MGTHQAALHQPTTFKTVCANREIGRWIGQLANMKREGREGTHLLAVARRDMEGDIMPHS